MSVEGWKANGKFTAFFKGPEMQQSVAMKEGSQVLGWQIFFFFVEGKLKSRILCETI